MSLFFEGDFVEQVRSPRPLDRSVPSRIGMRIAKDSRFQTTKKTIRTILTPICGRGFDVISFVNPFSLRANSTATAKTKATATPHQLEAV
jgi:hypothetical protein